MKNCEIIPMKSEHIKAIAELEKLCFAHPWSENSLREELENETAVFYAVIYNKKVVGYAGMNGIFNEGYITNIAVHPDYRGKGFGKAVLEKLINYCIENRYDFITLEVRPSNNIAIDLYSKLKFEKIGVRKGFYSSPKEDGLIMTRYFNNI